MTCSENTAELALSATADTTRKAPKMHEDCAKVTDAALARIAELEQELKAAYARGEKDGGAYVLDYLSTLFDGIEETDIWSEYCESEVSN